MQERRGSLTPPPRAVYNPARTGEEGDNVVGSTIGGYVVDQELGGGSTAYVYRAHRMDNGLTVAIKVLHTYLVKNTTIVERFRREAEVIAALQHPHIVVFYEYIEDGDRFCYVMEYLDTYTLETVLERKRRVPITIAVPIACELCDALAYAHSRDIVHRDIKPSNLFIAPDKGLILSDFGLAKPLGDAPITAVGTKMMGTPHFMAPEQVLGEETTPRTDLYQVGLILFQMLTGDLPFRDESHFKAIMARTLGGPEYADEHLRLVPGPLRTFIDRACKVDPAERYGSAIEMRRVLSEIYDCMMV